MAAGEAQASEPRTVGDASAPEPSVTSALERLLAASQGVVTKRIDLALLEAQEIVSRGVLGAALVGLSVLWVAAAWFALAACVVLLVTADANLIGRIGLFAVLNAGAAGVTVVTLQRRRPQAVLPPRVGGSETPVER